MGSKKTSKRKQVLSVDSSKTFENDVDGQVQRIPWASKYEIINSADLTSENGENDQGDNNMKDQEDGETSSSGSSSGNEVKVKKQTVLAGLSGYLSSSDSDNESENDQDLDSEVQAFLKEVDAIKLDKNGEIVSGTVNLSAPSTIGPPKAPPDNSSHQASATAAQHKAMREYYAAAGYTLPSTSWQECYDSGSGYSYYWNVETNQVTWEMPPEYQSYLQMITQQWEQYQYAQQAYQMGYQQQVQQHQQIPTAPAAPVTPSSGKKPNKKKDKKKRSWRKSESDDEKIELITSYGPHSDDESDDHGTGEKKNKKQKMNDSDDSDSDGYVNSKLSHVPDKGPPGMEEETEAEEAARRKKAEEAAAKRKAEAQARRADLQREIGRKKMALESIKQNDSERSKPTVEKADSAEEDKKKQKVSTPTETPATETKLEKEGGLSLVAGYGDDVESESEESKDESSVPTSAPVNEEKETKTDSKPPPERITSKIKLSARAKQLINASETTAKARQTDFISTPLGLRPCNEIEDESKGKEQAGKAGLGFVKSTLSKTSDGKNINFVKAETLNPKAETELLSDSDMKGKMELILDKLQFLCEGKDKVPLVQSWNIELEVLTKAWESGSLKVDYLTKRLDKVTDCLQTLESSAVPVGWVCQWNREEKKYSYQNSVTGELQWEFPTGVMEEAEVKEDGGGEEEMDLCTTPPPAPPRSPSSPPPPVISFSSPPATPPPPIISVFQDDEDEAPPLPADPPLPEEAPPLPPGDAPAPPLPPEEPPPPPGEPLPPGVEPPPPRPETPPPPPPPPASVPTPVPVVDYSHMLAPSHYHVGYHPHYMPHPPATSYSSSFVGSFYSQRSAPAAVNPPPPPEPVEKKSDLSSELDSFYSDLATLEPNEPAEPTPAEEPPKSPSPPRGATPPVPTPPPDTSKKKKKTKLAPGLALKKKNVSSLVAKWQKVQQSARRDF